MRVIWDVFNYATDLIVQRIIDDQLLTGNIHTVKVFFCNGFSNYKSNMVD